MADTLKVNFSDQEASSEAIDFTPVPSGTYPVLISDVETRESNSEKNPGKPYWHLEMTVVQEGHPYQGRKFWGNVMLWDGALYSLAQLLKAIGREDLLKSGKIPADPSFLVSNEIRITVQKVRDTYGEKKRAENGDDSTDPLFKNEVKGYKPAGSGGDATTSATGSSILP
jgi:hypothetical protein